MKAQRSLGRKFAWLWTAYAASTAGTWLAFDAFPLIAILVLHAGPTAVSALEAAGLTIGAVVALPVGPWVEFRRKRPVIIAMDLIRFAALMSVPVTFVIGWLSLAQLVVIAVIIAAADIAVRAASGAFVKAIVAPEDLLVASARFESTNWTALALGPPLGGAAIGLFGPVTTVVINAAGYLLSAGAICAIGDSEPKPSRSGKPWFRFADLTDGWRYILANPGLRPLFFNTVLVNGLIMATAPLLAVLMLGRLGFAPWQYGLAFGAPCIGGLVGSRLAGRLVARFGERQVMRASGALRACWSLGLAFIVPGPAGIVLVIALQFGLVPCVGVFNPVFSSFRLRQTANGRVARTLAAWSVTSNAAIAVLTALWGLLAGLTGPRVAIAIAGLLLLLTPLLLPGKRQAPQNEPEADRNGASPGEVPEGVAPGSFGPASA